MAVPTCYHMSMLTLQKKTLQQSVRWLTLLLNVKGLFKMFISKISEYGISDLVVVVSEEMHIKQSVSQFQISINFFLVGCVSPLWSAKAQRCFSVMRCLQTHLQATMSKEKLT